MSLPKFNLSKLRLAVSRQQAVTKKDIANLLLLDRLQSQLRKQSGERKDFDLPPLSNGEARFYVEFYTENEDGTVEYLDIKYIEPRSDDGYKVENFVIEKVTEYSKETLNNIFSKKDIVVYLHNMIYHHSQFHHGGTDTDFFSTQTFEDHEISLVKEDPKRNKIDAVYDITISDADLDDESDSVPDINEIRELKENLTADFLEVINFQILNEDTNLQIAENRILKCIKE